MALTNTQKLTAKLNSTPYKTQQLVYPQDLMQSNKGIGQYILFNINETKGSKYNNKTRIIENPSVIKSPYGDAPVISSSKTSIRAKFSNSSTRLKESIVLYMPETIKSTYGLSYNNAEMGAAGKLIHNTMSDLSLKDVGKIVGAEALSTATGVLSSVGGPNIKDLVNLQQGRVGNEMMEIIFSGLTNRTPSFQFKFTPRNVSEAKTIREIVRRFKFYAHPQLKNGTVNFYTAPYSVDIVFMQDGATNPWLHRFSTCVIQNIDVNYSGSGEYAVLSDGSPAVTTLDLSLTELELLSQDRFESEDGSF